MDNFYELNLDTPLHKPLVSGATAIEENILLALSLSKYDVTFEPDRDNVLSQSLFSINTIANTSLILARIDQVLSKYEPRISLIKSQCSITPYVPDGNSYAYYTYIISLVYTISGISGEQILNFSLSS